jgi:cytosine/adenosine deaminase-related metal-dependent hydrolase
MASTGNDRQLLAYGEFIVRFVAAQMLDPHRHFEQALIGRLALADSQLARERVLDDLLGWVAGGQLLEAAQRARLDAALGGRGWPSTALVREHPEVGHALLRRTADAATTARIREVLENAPISDADRDLLQQALSGQPPGDPAL